MLLGSNERDLCRAQAGTAIRAPQGADIRDAHPEPSQGICPDVPPAKYAIDVRTPVAYKQPVILIETSVFTRLVTKTLSDETMGRSSIGWLTTRMLGISSGAVPECEKLDGLCRAEVRAAVFACCTTGA